MVTSARARRRATPSQPLLPLAEGPRTRVRRPAPRLGRPRIFARGDERHCRRPRVKRYQPVLVTLRTVDGLKYLRNRHTCHALRKALQVSFRRRDIRICQISVQAGQIHLIVEADDYLALARGMQSLQISAAQHINRMFSRRTGVRCRGQVFVDRYHARVQRTPRQVRNAIRYVLGNWRRHGEDRGLGWTIDPYSSAPTFDGWIAPRGAAPRTTSSDGPLLPVASPRTWLLSEGWRRCGPLAPDERPGPPRR